MTIMPDGSYEVKSFATDTERNNVAAYGVFSGTLCDAVHRRQDQPHDEDLAFWNGTRGIRLGLNGRLPREG